MFLNNSKPLWKHVFSNKIFMFILNSLHKVRTRSFIWKLLGENKITQHLVPIQTKNNTRNVT